MYIVHAVIHLLCVKKLTGFEFDVNSLIENTNPGAIFFFYLLISVFVLHSVYLLKIILIFRIIYLEGINGNNPKWDNSPRLGY